MGFYSRHHRCLNELVALGNLDENLADRGELGLEALDKARSLFANLSRPTARKHPLYDPNTPIKVGPWTVLFRLMCGSAWHLCA